MVYQKKKENACAVNYGRFRHEKGAEG